MATDSVKILSLLFNFGRRMRDEHRTCSMLHFQTLRYVKEHGKPLMHDLAAYLCVTRPAATLLIDGLVKDKLLRRVLDPRDRRSVRIALTKQGNAFLARGIRAKTAKFKKALSVLTPKERAALVAILEKITGIRH